MTFFFFVVGLEARREFDIGELRERRRLALPLLAGARRDGRAGRDLPGGQRRRRRRRTAGAWRCRPTPRSRSGMLALVGPRFPDRLRASCSPSSSSTTWSRCVVIAVVYSEHVDARAAAGRASALFARGRSACAPPASAAGSSTSLLGVAAWVALLESRRRPGRGRPGDRACSTYAYPAARGDLERATEPVPAASASSRPPELARVGAASGCARRSRRTSGCSSSTTRGRATSIVPLFALANAGIAIDGELPRRARSPRRSRSGIVRRLRASASRSGIVGVAWLVTPAQPRPAAAAGRLGRGARAAARSPASASPSRC